MILLVHVTINKIFLMLYIDDSFPFLSPGSRSQFGMSILLQSESKYI